MNSTVLVTECMVNSNGCADLNFYAKKTFSQVELIALFWVANPIGTIVCCLPLNGWNATECFQQTKCVLRKLHSINVNLVERLN